MLPRHIVLYPWDLTAADTEQVLDQIQGEIGFTGISLGCATPPVRELRAREVEPRFLQTEGGLCFTPSPGKYEGTRLEHSPCTDAAPRVWDQVVQSCHARKLALRLVVSATRIGQLAREHPWAASCNVYGDVSSQSTCLLNANVQAYLADLLTDVSTRFGPHEVMLTDFQTSWSEATGHALDDNLPPDATTRALLSTCFCPSCHQSAGAAGVDVPAVKATVTEVLARCFDAVPLTPPAWEALLAEQPALEAYYRWRAAALGMLWRRLAQACKVDLLLFRSRAPVEQAHHYGLDRSLPAGVVSELRAADDLPAASWTDARKNLLHVPARLAAQLAPDRLVALLAQAAKTQWQGVEVSSYGQLSDTLLDALRPALRFARRSARVD